MIRLSAKRLIGVWFLFCLGSLSFAKTSVVKVDPPNWWIGMPQNPMLMVTGNDLGGTQVSLDYPGVTITRTEPGQDGRYLFVWLRISPQTKPGVATFKVSGGQGSATFGFSLAGRGRIAGKFTGISEDDVIYLIMPDRFADGDTSNDTPPGGVGQTDRSDPHKWHGGDLKGVTDHLDYLKNLGVTAIWLTPWWKQDNARADYHGYHVVDFYSVDDHLGTMKDLQQMITEAHKRGIKVISDYVVNHTGPTNAWAEHPPTATWIHGTLEHHLTATHDFQYLIDPHAVPQQYQSILEGWFAGILPDLNPDDPILSEYLIDNSIWWMQEAGFDAYRLDTFPYSPRDFWSRWHKALFTNFPNTWTVGEVKKGDPWITSFFVGGRVEEGIDTGLTTVFDFPMEDAIRQVFAHGASAKQLVQVLEHDDLYVHPSELVTLIGNHDDPRFLSEPGATVQEMKAATEFLLTVRGIPQLYAGDEIAMTGGADPDNRRDFPGGFPGDTQNAFTTAGRTAEHQDLYATTHGLLALRREHAALRRGKQFNIGCDDDYYAYLREDGNDRLLMVVNTAHEVKTIKLDLRGTPLSNAIGLVPLRDGKVESMQFGSASVSVSGMSVAVFKVD